MSPFVDGRCKTPIEEIQVTVAGIISKEQAAKLRQCLNYIDELEMHKAEIEREIFRLSDKYECVLNLVRTVPEFNKNPLTAIQVVSEIRGDVSVFPTAKTSYHGLDVVLVMIRAIKKSNPLGFPTLISILNQYWCKLQVL